MEKDSENLNSCGVASNQCIEDSTKDDQEFLEVLRSLNGELFYAVLKDHKFTTESLKFLKASHLNDLLPKSLYGPRVIFEYNLQKWQMNQGIDLSEDSPVTPSQSGSTLSITSSFERTVENFNEFSVDNVLKKTHNGKQILKFYEENKYLTPKYRKLLANSTTEYLLSKNISATPTTFEQIADKIVNYFKSETKEIYYIHYKGKKPGGSLYSKYHSSLFKLRKDGLLKKNETISKQQTVSPNAVKSSNEIDFSPGEDDISDQYWLKYNIEPIDEVRSKWEKTFDFRKQSLRGTLNLNEILERWPLYKQSFGHTLIDYDFGRLFPGKEQSIFQKWQDFTETILPLMQQRIKDLKSLESLEKYKSGNFNTDVRDNLISILLHSLLVPTNRKFEGNSGLKKLKKFSILDSRNSFLILGSTHCELKSKVKFLVDSNFDAKRTIQPIICGIGCDAFDLSQYYVYFFETYYKFNSIVKCIDVCFKIFNVLDLKYPEECMLIWTFFQNYFYDIHLITDKKSSSLSALLADLKNHKTSKA